MFLLIVTLYYNFKNYVFPENGRKRNRLLRSNTSEMQEIFSKCSHEKDNKIRSSLIIEAISVKYQLNDEIKRTLANKLDPDNVDLLYTKDDLVSTFKEWMSSAELNIDKSPFLFHSPSKRYPSMTCSFTSTPISSVGPKHKLISRQLYKDDGNSDAELVDSDERPNSTSSTGSAMKGLLLFNKTVLEARLQTSELHANSLEAKYEALNELCEKQKLEIERLKQESKARHETVQMMEEMSEFRRQQELMTEDKLARVQSELSSAKSDLESANLKGECLENLVAELKGKINVYKSKINEAKSAQKEREQLEILQLELSDKIEKIQELTEEVETLTQLKTENEFTISALSEEIAIMIAKTSNEFSNNNNFSQEVVVGRPLCDELPSTMLHFPMNFTNSETSDSRDNPDSGRVYITQETQTSFKDFGRSSTTHPKTTTFSQTEQRVDFCKDVQTEKIKTQDKSLQIYPEFKTTYSQTIKRLHICHETQTEYVSVAQLNSTHFAQTMKNDLRCLFVIIWKFLCNTATTSLSIFVALLAMITLFLYVCQNNRCQPVFRFNRGLPPV